MARLLKLAGLLFVGALVGALIFLPAKDYMAGGTPVGRWLTQSGNLEIEIASCGEALCGTVALVLANQSMSQPGAGMKSAGAPAATGMKILSELTPSGDGEWKGRIYNRENGKTYDCVVGLAAADQLEVRGYVFRPLIGKTQVWTRVTARKS
jgi:uncharacterized protein (DUF2147 family)